MFTGITSTTIDAKARITIPTEYRDAVKAACGGQIVITVDIDRCLLIYPKPEWERFETDLRALPNVGKQVRRWHRLYLGHAKPREIDGQHRILLPQELRDFAGLKKHVCLVGQGNKFELWDQTRWEEALDGWLDDEAGSLVNESPLDTLSV